MSVPLRLAVFAAGLALAFVVAFGVGRATAAPNATAPGDHGEEVGGPDGADATGGH